jgi:hypothetical protein
VIVTPFKTLGIAASGISAAALAGGWAWRSVRRRRKSPDEIERLRRLGVNACGRIITGKIIELAEPVADGPTGPILLYEYEVAGVTYAAAQDVSALPEVAAAAPFLPGQTTSIKYDPKQPPNSILACETWCGIPDLDLNRNVQNVPREESVAAVPPKP